MNIIRALSLLFIIFLSLSCRREEVSLSYSSGAKDVSGVAASVARLNVEVQHPDIRRVDDRAVPLIGAWRKVASNGDDMGDSGHRLAVFPRVPLPGTRFVVYDYDAGRVICCVRVDGKGLDINHLLDSLRVPAPRALELLDVLWTDYPDYSPEAVEITIEGDFSNYESKDWERSFGGGAWLFNVERGAILLPEGSRMVGPHVLEIGGESYDVIWNPEWIGADDGVKDVYVFRPQSGGDDLRVGITYSSAR